MNLTPKQVDHLNRVTIWGTNPLTGEDVDMFNIAFQTHNSPNDLLMVWFTAPNSACQAYEWQLSRMQVAWCIGATKDHAEPLPSVLDNDLTRSFNKTFRCAFTVRGLRRSLELTEGEGLKEEMWQEEGLEWEMRWGSLREVTAQQFGIPVRQLSGWHKIKGQVLRAEGSELSGFF